MTEIRYDARQKQIEDAALAVFIERGFEHTTLEAVAEKLGYTKQAIYYYFKNKEELVCSFCFNILKDARDEVIAICSAKRKPEEKLGSLIGYHVQGSCERQGFFALHHNLKQIVSRINDEKKKNEMFLMMKEIPDMILSVIREGVGSGVFRKEEPEVLSGIVFAMLGGVIMMNEIKPLQELVSGKKSDLVTDIILKGIRK